MMKCENENCNRTLANTRYTLDFGYRRKTICPLCFLGPEEGAQSKCAAKSPE